MRDEGAAVDEIQTVSLRCSSLANIWKLLEGLGGVRHDINHGRFLLNLGNGSLRSPRRQHKRSLERCLESVGGGTPPLQILTFGTSRWALRRFKRDLEKRIKLKHVTLKVREHFV